MAEKPGHGVRVKTQKVKMTNGNVQAHNTTHTRTHTPQEHEFTHNTHTRIVWQSQTLAQSGIKPTYRIVVWEFTWCS